MRERLVWAADWVCPGMTRIIADISVSLDGFVTGPDPSPDNGLGTGGEALHTWAFSDDPDDRRVLREATARSGAVVLGRHLADVVDGPKGWDDTTGYGAGEVGKPIVLGAGTPLFTGGAPRTLVQRSVISTSTATHLTYDVSR